ncbi:hypothetical protein TPADAL_0776 [Treponema pallidum subsp. pallidum DAL-1]|uniref:ComF family protein n=2 Tax=Treponema pallidum subsp. pallidum TaxID=161 RepID=O83755_TREPA|nr:conserved hypothetical protein [Treponema pallidum subsp. pallidum str. Nichols]ACD71194.1 hypothetical protein TPASS_0776 [Treponema pallidum subsp. pallidum SS14]ADD72872.1 conserved hypothetical protein [Treponema pallidum subsp. pallidum str. Chicago]AEZ61102.1 hypothetical protein TPADAL_0776 [Treponema pallidum subsp. pallidum DAL-1]AFU66759.1 hypothetical protein TPAMA_0776 [Treponema pallidum subsp. pallidum str. Mexico A]AHN67435.1 hypothetical protein TPSea814_000776 [Treponema pa
MILFSRARLWARDGVARAYVSFLGPRRCVFCASRCTGTVPLCCSCVQDRLYARAHDFLEHPEDFCSRCAKPLVSARALCVSCRALRESGETPALWRVFSLLPYLGVGRPLMSLWKTQQERNFDALFSRIAGCFLRTARERSFVTASTELVPVPPRPCKMAERGWDQVEDVSRRLELAGFTVNRALVRVEGRFAQKTLSRAARVENLAGSIELGAHARVPRDALIIDDVVTTYATMDACARVLRSSGSERVQGFSFFFA